MVDKKGMGVPRSTTLIGKDWKFLQAGMLQGRPNKVLDVVVNRPESVSRAFGQLFVSSFVGRTTCSSVERILLFDYFCRRIKHAASNTLHKWRDV